jgi:hypothetical protein
MVYTPVRLICHREKKWYSSRKLVISEVPPPYTSNKALKRNRRYWLTLNMTLDRAGPLTKYLYNKYMIITDISSTRTYRQYFAQ